MPECEHKRTEFMMRRDGTDYLRCLDCDQVFEAEDLEQQTAEDEEPGREVNHEPRRKKAS
jgi:hypothetical protein